MIVPTPGQGSGSGAVIDREGHVLTNFHVVEEAKEIQVTLSGGKSYSAELIGHDAEHDIAILKIDAPASRAVSRSRSARRITSRSGSGSTPLATRSDSRAPSRPESSRRSTARCPAASRAGNCSRLFRPTRR